MILSFSNFFFLLESSRLGIVLGGVKRAFENITTKDEKCITSTIFVAWLPWQPGSHCYQNDLWGDVSVFGQV